MARKPTEVVSIAADGAAGARTALERCVLAGGVAVFPADGVYGLACDPARAEAIERIHALKGRDAGKPSAVMFFSPLAMREVVAGLGPRTRDALGALLPGAVTLVVANPERRYPLACGDDPDRLGLRLIEGSLAGTEAAIFQTSANRSGEAAPSRFADLDPEIAAGADLAIDGGELAGAPSTVVDLSGLDAGAGWRVLRQWAVSAGELAARLTRAGIPSPAPAAEE
jgi:L-threonylcarbamoyladenylate synthase